MNETAIAREDVWMQIVGPLAAKPVLATVSPVISDDVVLRPAVPDLERIAATALDALGVVRTGVRIVAESQPGAFMRELSEPARNFIALRPNDALARAIDWRLLTGFDEQVEHALAPSLLAQVDQDRAFRLRRRLWIEAFRRPNTDARNGLGQLGTMILQVRYAVTFHLAAFVMARRTEPLPALRSLLGLIRAGNVPMGAMHDGTLVLLTA